MSQLFNFKERNSVGQAVGFYVVFVILGFIVGFIVGFIYGAANAATMPLEELQEQAVTVGAYVSSIYAAIVYYVVILSRGLKKLPFLLGGIVVILAGYFVGAIGAMLLIAIVTTLESDIDRKVTSANAEEPVNNDFVGFE